MCRANEKPTGKVSCIHYPDHFFVEALSNSSFFFCNRRVLNLDDKSTWRFDIRNMLFLSPTINVHHFLTVDWKSVLPVSVPIGLGLLPWIGLLLFPRYWIEARPSAAGDQLATCNETGSDRKTQTRSAGTTPKSIAV